MLFENDISFYTAMFYLFLVPIILLNATLYVADGHW